MKNSEEQKILGIIIDNKLTSKVMLKKSSQNIQDLARLSRYLNDAPKSLIFKSVIRSQISYWPKVWMVCSTQTNIMTNKLHLVRTKNFPKN